ncbi:hypothetical protein BSL78_13604 [Apostichopus japonicus]|uniref:C2H2-type domain-containing protein n=1 Tax=Stichopus japonicus TaxID=307972 RepID=A0A2G8KNF5_STIJA|nr:hypothetical protein BSL78_13604 [Apostichopus japonicus]
MEDLLKSWGLFVPDIIQSMKDNDIDLEALPLLQEDDIKLLIPKIGLRRKFINRWQEREISGGVKSLFKHLKYYHHITSGTQTRIVCSQNGCTNTFSFTTSYQRHLLRVHEAENDVGGNNDNVVPQDIDMNENDIDMNENDNLLQPGEYHNGDVEDILETIALFIANMKASSVPFSFIQRVISEVELLIVAIVKHLQAGVNDLVREIDEKIFPDKAKCDTVLQEFVRLQMPFHNLKTQYQQDKYFEERGVLIKPSEIELGRSYVTQVDNTTGRIVQVQKPDTYQYIPLETLLKAHLEQPGMMKAILEKTASNNNDVLETLIM